MRFGVAGSAWITIAATIRFRLEEGAHVATNFIGRRAAAEDALSRVKAASRDRGHGERDHFIVEADIGSEAAIARMFETVLARWPHLDCLVNNAPFKRSH